MIATDVFAAMARLQAASLGMRGLPVISIPHPIQSQASDVVRGWAREILDDVVRALTTPATVLAVVAPARRPGN